MNHKATLTEDEIIKKIELLKKQRDGLIIGSYRSILADLYNNIKSVKDTIGNECFLSMLQKKYSSNNEHQKNVILDCCLDLEQLGYIQIEDNERILIKKDLDF